MSIPLLMVMLGLLWTAGMMALIGDKLNVVTVACPMIVLCVGSAYVIKLINEYQLNYREIVHSLKVSREVVDRQQIVNRTVETVAVPVS